MRTIENLLARYGAGLALLGLFATIVLSTGCMPEPDQYYDVDIDVYVEDDGEDTGLPTDDTGMIEDECLEEECCFQVETASGGTVEMQTSFEVMPLGHADHHTDPGDVFVLGWDSQTDTCGGASTREFYLQFESSDGNGYDADWVVDAMFNTRVYIVSEYRGGSPAEMTGIPQGNGLVQVVGDAESIPGDLMYTYVMVTAEGMDDGDWLQVSLVENTMVIDDGQTIATIPNPEIEGGVITFDVTEPDPIPTAFTITQLTSPASSTVVRGGRANMLGIRIEVGDRPVVIDRIQPQIESDDDGQGLDNDVTVIDNHFQWCEINTVNGIAAIEPVSSNSCLYFEPEVELQANTTYEWSFDCNLSHELAQSGTPDEFALAIPNAWVIDATYADNADAVAHADIDIPLGDINWLSPWTVITKIDHSELNAGMYAMSPNDYVVEAGDLSQLVGIWRFDAFYEAGEVKNLVFGVIGDWQAIDSACVVYTDAAGNVNSQCGVVGSTGVQFSGLDMYVPQGDFAVIELRVHVSDYAQAGDQVHFFLDPMASFLAYGLTSGHTFSHPSAWGNLESAVLTVVDECSFETELANGGTVYMGNEVYITRSSSSPAGLIVPGMNNIAEYRVGTWSDCSGALIDGFDLTIFATDNNQSDTSDWTQAIYVEFRLSDNSVLWSGTVVAGESTPVQLGLSLNPLQAPLLRLFADTSDASAVMDDSIVARIDDNSLDWTDDNNVAVDVVHEAATGNALSH